jgi:hypothetical protein
VAEREDLLAVAIGDRSDGAKGDVPGGEGRRDGGARHELLRRIAAQRAGRGGQHRAVDAVGGAAEQAARVSREAGHRERARERSGGTQEPGITARGGRRGGTRAQDRLDRRGQHDLVAVVADALRDRPGVAPAADDRRAREARTDTGGVHRRARDSHEQTGAADSRVAGDHVEHADVERGDLGAVDHR